MARIRTVKPELWTDPEFVELSLSARLLFIASLNFATDHGVIHNKPRQIKMQCLPADDVDVVALIEELVSARLMIPCVAPNGDAVLVIRTFAKNQRINRPTDGRWGDPQKWPTPPEMQRHSLRPPVVLIDGRDNSDRVIGSVSPPVDNDPFGNVVALGYVKLQPSLLSREQRQAIIDQHRKAQP